MVRLRYLLDTNILSKPIAARPNPFVLERIKATDTSLAISSVTWQEVLYGMFLLPAGKRHCQIEDYLFRRILPALPIIGFDGRAAQAGRTTCPSPSSGQISFLPRFPDHRRERFGVGEGLPRSRTVTRNRGGYRSGLESG